MSPPPPPLSDTQDPPGPPAPLAPLAPPGSPARLAPPAPGLPACAPNARQQALLDEVRLRGAVSVERLALRLNVTMQTVRRDVQRLSEAGLLQRFHGGARLAPRMPARDAWAARQALQADAKARIARSVAAAVPAGSTLMLGNGTTVEAVARALLGKPALQVITHNLAVAQALSEQADGQLQLTGGTLRARDSALEGEATLEGLRRCQADIAIVSLPGIDADGSLRDLDRRELPALQAMMAQSRQTWLVMDASKFGHSAPVRAARLQDLRRVFTDALPPAPFAALLHDAGVTLTIAP